MIYWNRIDLDNKAMVFKEISKPHKTDKVNSDKQHNSTNNQSNLYLVNDGHSQKDNCDPQQHILYSYWTDVAVLVVVYVK